MKDIIISGGRRDSKINPIIYKMHNKINRLKKENRKYYKAWKKMQKRSYIAKTSHYDEYLHCDYLQAKMIYFKLMGINYSHAINKGGLFTYLEKYKNMGKSRKIIMKLAKIERERLIKRLIND